MQTLTLTALLACLTAAAALSLFGRLQSAGAMGTLMCNGRPASNVKVKLYDEDDFGIDDLMREGRTDSNGRFQLIGSEREITPIDPKVNIYHDCNDNLPCQRKFSIKIPNSYISSGSTPQRLYNVGTIELAGRFSGESRDCFNK